MLGGLDDLLEVRVKDRARGGDREDGVGQDGVLGYERGGLEERLGVVQESCRELGLHNLFRGHFHGDPDVRGGVVGREMREPRLESDTGEVGRLTVTGTLELRVRLKQKDGLEFITPGGEGWSYLLVGMVGVVVKVLGEAATGLTASILRPSAEETTTSLCTVPAGTTIL